jgi:glyoxylase-like metal-dependent hydrolase (beta-lactamase superfamily II)
MAEVKVLVEGYAKEINGKECASSTCTLIIDGKTKVIVDPGMDKKKLLSALKKESLTPKDIDYVILSHTHPDHMLLTAIFDNALILDDGATYSFDAKISEHNGNVPGTDIKIMPTPGHDQFHCATIVKTDKGIIVIAADVFWWLDKDEQKTDRKSLLEHKDPYVKDQKALLESRKKILDVADWIIPGHGKMFRVKK